MMNKIITSTTVTDEQDMTETMKVSETALPQPTDGQEHSVAPNIQSETPEQVERADLIIDPEFQDVFSTKTLEDGYEALKEDIRQRGILDKLIGWKETGIVLDGHTRYAIHGELEMKEPLPIQWLSFADRKEAKAWMLQHQIMRRNLNIFRRAEAILQLNDFYTEKARERQINAGKDLTQIFGEGGEVNEALGKLISTSPETIRKVKKILQFAVQEDIEALRSGEVSISKIYDKCTGGDAEEPKPATATTNKVINKQKPKQPSVPSGNGDRNLLSKKQNSGKLQATMLPEWTKGTAEERRSFVNHTLDNMKNLLPVGEGRIEFFNMVFAWAARQKRHATPSNP
jgi:hypothetical protein